MVSTTQSSYSTTQVTAWIRGLLTVAWADGNFDDEERALIDELTRTDLAPELSVKTFSTITASELASTLGADTQVNENFLRMAVMVALADGLYSAPEHGLLKDFSTALGLDTEVLEAIADCMIFQGDESDIQPNTSTQTSTLGAVGAGPALPDAIAHTKVLEPVRDWLDGLDVHDPRLARFLCKMIPSQCPFERNVTLFGRKVVHIPPLCKLNPLYDQLVGLRFRALSYLADDCGEDVRAYI